MKLLLNNKIKATWGGMAFQNCQRKLGFQYAVAKKSKLCISPKTTINPTLSTNRETRWVPLFRLELNYHPYQ